MRIPSKVKLLDDQITVSVAGPGYGEAIFINIGGKIRIGIDSCKSLLQERHGHPGFLEEQLAGMDKDHYLFWILTHYHFDHFQSLSNILDKFGDKCASIIIPSDYTEADVWRNVVEAEAKDSPRPLESAHIAKGEYERLRILRTKKAWQAKYKSSATGMHEWISAQMLTPGKDKVRLEVDYHCTQEAEYSALLAQALQKGMEETAEWNSRDTANKGAYILHIKAGQFDGLFLSDAESVRTEELLQSRSKSDARVFCLKVAHHGSPDGTTEAMLDRYCGTASTCDLYAFIAPFKHHNLPREEVITMLTDRGFKLYISGTKVASPSISGDIARQLEHLIKVKVHDSIAAGTDIISESFYL